MQTVKQIVSALAVRNIQKTAKEWGISAPTLYKAAEGNMTGKVRTLISYHLEEEARSVLSGGVGGDK